MSDLFSTGIRPAVDAHLLKLAQEKRDYGLYWSASSAGYCQRKVIFDRLGIPPVQEDARKQRVFTAGHIFHEWIQRITKDAGLSIAQELELQDEEFMIRGHFDDLVLIKSDEMRGTPKFKDTSHLILYDYKSRNSRNFNYANKPSHYHRMQLGTYMYMLRKNHHGEGAFNHTPEVCPLVQSLTEARTLNIEKDTLRMCEVQYLWDEALERDVLTYWRTLNESWNNKVLPPCTCAEYEKNSKTGIGFMADPRYNPYFANGKPCSLEYAQRFPELLNKWRAA